MSAKAPDQATEDNWAFPPAGGWTFDQVKNLELPFDWELVDGMIVVRGRTKAWHNRVRDQFGKALELAQVAPLAMLTESCVMLDDRNVRVPDVMAYDATGLSFFETECIPVSRLALVVEVVSPGSRSVDRLHKPAEFAAAKVPYYWRVELERDEQLAVHEYWLNVDTRAYIPAPAHPVHRGELATDFPYPVKIDLTAITEF